MKKKGLSLLVSRSRRSRCSCGGAGAKSSKHSATTLSGAGSSFVSPLVSTWTPALGSAVRLHDPVQPDRLGRAASRRSRTAQVDFGASDAPLTPDQFTACNGCVQIPWALAGTAIPYNVPGPRAAEEHEPATSPAT